MNNIFAIAVCIPILTLALVPLLQVLQNFWRGEPVADVRTMTSLFALIALFIALALFVERADRKKKDL